IRAGQSEPFAQDVDEKRAGLDLEHVPCPIDRDRARVSPRSPFGRGKLRTSTRFAGGRFHAPLAVTTSRKALWRRAGSSRPPRYMPLSRTRSDACPWLVRVPERWALLHQGWMVFFIDGRGAAFCPTSPNLRVATR